MILFIDDNPKRVALDVAELRSRGFEVELLVNADAANAYFKEGTASVEAVVCDIVMPPGVLPPESALDGLRTGLTIVNTVRQVDAKLPIVIFTNVLREDLGPDVELGGHSIYLYKPDCLPRDFADRVQHFLEAERKEMA